jgi:uncharacterized protein YndB with AHSA1/START domain
LFPQFRPPAAVTWERRAEVRSPATPERVWLVLLDGLRWHEWNRGVEWMTVEGALRPGTHLTMKPRGAPQTAFRIETVDAARRLGLVLTFGPLATLRFRWELTPLGEGTAIAQTVAIGGPFAGTLLRRRAESIAAAMPANLERLAARAETP